MTTRFINDSLSLSKHKQMYQSVIFFFTHAASYVIKAVTSRCILSKYNRHILFWLAALDNKTQNLTVETFKKYICEIFKYLFERYCLHLSGITYSISQILRQLSTI